MKGFLAALAFLTAIPVPRAAAAAPAREALPWYPVVGLLLGAILLGASRALEGSFPPLVLGVLLAGTWAALTGFLHLDGVADSCDGLLATGSRERRLEILRDPRAGAYAVAGVALAVLLKAACLAEPAARTAPALLLAGSMSRWLALALAAVFPPARPEGMGRELSASARRPAVALAAAVPIIIIVVAGGARSVIAALLAAACALAIGLLARRRLGGVTGDVLGLAIEAAEIAVLLVHCVQREGGAWGSV